MNDLSMTGFFSSWRWQHAIGLFVIAFACIVLRRPDVLLTPQFWAEDGRIWFQNAYNIGPITSLFVPMNGYFQTVSRAVAALAQLVPLHFAPDFFNIIAIGIKTLPVLLLFSARFASIVPRMSTKVLLAAIYLFLPNVEEIYANITNAHTFLALLAFMTVVAPPPHTVREKITDTATYLFSGLSGPFVLFLLPIIAVRWYATRATRATLCRYGVSSSVASCNW